MNSDLKIGDKVKVLIDYPIGSKWAKGYEGIITDIDGFLFHLDNATRGWVLAEHIELVIGMSAEQELRGKIHSILKERFGGKRLTDVSHVGTDSVTIKEIEAYIQSKFKEPKLDIKVIIDKELGVLSYEITQI